MQVEVVFALWLRNRLCLLPYLFFSDFFVSLPVFMSAHAVVKGCVGVAKVLPYILNMLVRPADQLAMLCYRIASAGCTGAGKQNNS